MVIPYNVEIYDVVPTLIFNAEMFQSAALAEYRGFRSVFNNSIFSSSIASCESVRLGCLWVHVICQFYDSGRLVQ